MGGAAQSVQNSEALGGAGQGAGEGGGQGNKRAVTGGGAGQQYEGRD